MKRRFARSLNFQIHARWRGIGFDRDIVFWELRLGFVSVSVVRYVVIDMISAFRSEVEKLKTLLRERDGGDR